jgi:phenylacetate-coenzyme A ligase PaaK-like adenylate-forming protein
MVSKATHKMHELGYVPPRDTWSPVDEALYGVDTLFRLPKERADELRFNAVKHAFGYWYEESKWYHMYCNEFDFKPESLKTQDDLNKVPLISQRFFKAYLEGQEFINWLMNISINKVEKPKMSKKHPSMDELIDVFAEKGLMAVYSSGTSGRFSFIPKDQTTYMRSQYALGKMGISEMLEHWYDDSAYAYLCGPNPSKTNMWVGKVVKLMDDVYTDVQYAIDREITTQLMRISNGDIRGLSDAVMAGAMQLMGTTRKITGNVIKWLEAREKAGDRVFIAEAPFIMQRVMDELDKQGRSFDFGEKGAIITGGGWKLHDTEEIPLKEFRDKAERILGIPPMNNIDLYTMVESNWHAIQCPEGHYLHLPPTLVYPMVLDENNRPLGYGETGRFAFIDHMANSYPGAIITGDMVTLLEECPVCGRIGPVLEPNVRRMSGEEVRGCAEEMRKLMDEQTPELLHDLVCTPDRARMPMMLLDKDES